LQIEDCGADFRFAIADLQLPRDRRHRAAEDGSQLPVKSQIANGKSKIQDEICN